MSSINEILFKLEGFQYAKSLGLNMVYYHIWLTEDTSDLLGAPEKNVPGFFWASQETREHKNPTKHRKSKGT